MLHHKTDLHLSVHQVAGHQLTAVHTNKFKTMTIAWYMERPLDALTSVYALAVRLMVRAFGGDDPMGVNRRLQGLYGAYLQADAVKYGDLQSLQLKLTFVSDLHLKHSIGREALTCFSEIFTSPVTAFAGFEQLMHLEKNNLTSAIVQRDQDRSAKTYDSLLDSLFPNESYSRTPFGSVTDVQGIEVEQVAQAINTMISSTPYNLKIIGDMLPENYLSVLSEVLPMAVHSQSYQRKLLSTMPQTAHISPSFLVEYHKIEQAKLAVGFEMGSISSPESYYAAILLGHMLGGGPSALLFQEVREKRGLCYAIHARVDKFLGILTVHAGLQFEKVEEVKWVLEDLLKMLVVDEIDDIDLERSKKMLLGSYFSMADTPVGCLNFIHSQWVCGLPESIEEVVAYVSQVQTADIKSAAQGLRLIGGVTFAPKEKHHD